MKIIKKFFKLCLVASLLLGILTIINPERMFLRNKTIVYASTRSTSTISYKNYRFMQYGKIVNKKIAPSSTKIWQVEYRNKVKYEGWIQYTGKSKDPGRYGATFEYSGTLNKAK